MDFTVYDNWRIEQKMNCAIVLRGSEIPDHNHNNKQDHLFGYVDTAVETPVANGFSDFFNSNYAA